MLSADLSVPSEDSSTVSIRVAEQYYIAEDGAGNRLECRGDQLMPFFCYGLRVRPSHPLRRVSGPPFPSRARANT